MVLTRETERKRYEQIYRKYPTQYVCKGRRLPSTERAIKEIPFRGSYLDVGCGTGQMLAYAKAVGFPRVVGVDHVSAGADVVAEAHRLPFPNHSFDVVVMLDVLEHLIPGDDFLALLGIARIAKRFVLLSASNRPSVWDGFDLHINKKPYDRWEELFDKCIKPRTVRRYESTSPIWRLDL